MKLVATLVDRGQDGMSVIMDSTTFDETYLIDLTGGVSIIAFNWRDGSRYEVTLAKPYPDMTPRRYSECRSKGAGA